MIATSRPSARATLADELREVDVVLARAVREIEPDDVSARGEHPPQHIRLAARGP
jgi:hypothetical protein